MKTTVRTTIELTPEQLTEILSERFGKTVTLRFNIIERNYDIFDRGPGVKYVKSIIAEYEHELT